MKEIRLGTAQKNSLAFKQGLVVKVDDEDFEALSKFHWSFVKGNRNKTGYARRTVSTGLSR
jgi:hypothetical protein